MPLTPVQRAVIRAGLEGMDVAANPTYIFNADGVGDRLAGPEWGGSLWGLR